MGLHNIKTPSSKKYSSDGTSIELIFNSTQKANQNFNKLQTFFDQTVGRNLKDYVSYRDGVQEGSIDKANTYGKGYVKVNVNYARYQAYSSKIKKRAGKRGTRPFERMKADKSKTILNQVKSYMRRLTDG